MACLIVFLNSSVICYRVMKEPSSGYKLGKPGMSALTLIPVQITSRDFDFKTCSVPDTNLFFRVVPPGTVHKPNPTCCTSDIVVL